MHPTGKTGVNLFMRRQMTPRTFLAAALLSPLAATCSPPESILAEAHQQVLKSAEDRLVAFLIDGEVPAVQRQVGLPTVVVASGAKKSMP